MDLKAVGQRIKMAREAKGLTQEDLAAMVELSPTHVSVIERGLKAAKLDTFVAIANALEVSADSLLIDVVAHSVTGVTNELSEMIGKLPKEEQKKIIRSYGTWRGQTVQEVRRRTETCRLFQNLQAFHAVTYPDGSSA